MVYNEEEIESEDDDDEMIGKKHTKGRWYC